MSIKYKSFANLIFGIFLIGLSVGYVIGYYVCKFSSSNYLFYISALIMGFGCFLLLYGVMFLKSKKNGN
tara:strand:+ start:386 stop:592 length:207 start_codon:yes stop_codon:yes gene_type:complete